MASVRCQRHAIAIGGNVDRDLNVGPIDGSDNDGDADDRSAALLRWRLALLPRVVEAGVGDQLIVQVRIELHGGGEQLEALALAVSVPRASSVHARLPSNRLPRGEQDALIAGPGIERKQAEGQMDSGARCSCVVHSAADPRAIHRGDTGPRSRLIYHAKSSLIEWARTGDRLAVPIHMQSL